MVIIKNATTGSRQAEAERPGKSAAQVQSEPPHNWAQNKPQQPVLPDNGQGRQPTPRQRIPEIETVPETKAPPQTEVTETSVEEWFNQLMARAIESRTSDIHLEPERENFVIRIRVDGLLHPFESLDFEFQEIVISRIKVMGQMDITKRRLPQDGGFEFGHKGHIYNIRVSTYPTIYGESAVLRILERESALLDLRDLGFDEIQLKVFNKLIHRPYGMMLITGPSGSGKTTLLYSALNVLNTPNNNIMTIEDPVEVQMNKMRQAQTNQYQDFNFPTALRAVLRQDPDIVMVGEIRDKETAQISIQAALTGKLIFSTFHTLDVFAVVTRLIEMDIPRSVVAHTLEGVVSSRLVRKICPMCKTSHQPTEGEKRMFGEHLKHDKEVFAGKGCDHCVGTGYYGRIGIFEVVAFDDDIRTAILRSAPSGELLALMYQKKIKRLHTSAMDKVYQGITTVEEVLRVTGQPM